MDKVQDLFTQLICNLAEIENVTKNIKKFEEQNADPEILEDMYKNEFILYMNNVGIYEDLMLWIERTEKTSDNEFELARIKRDAAFMCKVEVIQL